MSKAEVKSPALGLGPPEAVGGRHENGGDHLHKGARERRERERKRGRDAASKQRRRENKQKTKQKKIQKINLITEFLLCKKNDDIKSTPSFRKHTNTHTHTYTPQKRGKKKTKNILTHIQNYTQTHTQPHKSLSS